MKNIKKLRNIKIDSLSVRRAVITEKQSVKSKDLINRSRNRFVVAKKHILTSQGMQALEDELQDLKVVKRKEIAQKIKEAREQGDLSENAEYDAAKDEQRSMEARIEELEKIIKNAEVIDESAYDKDTVSIGSTVKFYDEEFDEELEYRIVGSTESDILKGLISNESPLGKGLIGAKIGETVQVESPDGFSRYKILGISRE